MSQIKTKFLEDNAVTGAKTRLGNNEALRARNAAGTADVSVLKVTAADQLELQALPQIASSLPVPVSDKQLVTVEYVKNYVQGKVDAKDAVNVLFDTNVALTGTTTLVGDGFTVLNNWRVGLGNQTVAAQNGIYVAAISGPNWTLTRAADFDQVDDASGKEVTSGAYFKVISGTVYAGYEVILNTPDPIVVGTTALTFIKNPTSATLTGGDGIAKVGQDFAVDLATNGGLESTNPGNQAGQIRVKTATGVVEKDRTAQVDTGGNVVAKRSRKQSFTLAAQDITNGYVDLPDVAGMDSVALVVAGAPPQAENTDYTVNYTGGTSSKTRVTFAGGLASAGVSALAAGDVISVLYTAF